MSPAIYNDLFHEAAKLPERDRATLAGLLIETLDPAPEADVQAAWSQEIARRMAQVDVGAVELIPWEEVREELFGRRQCELAFIPRRVRKLSRQRVVRRTESLGGLPLRARGSGCRCQDRGGAEPIRGVGTRDQAFGAPTISIQPWSSALMRMK